MTVPAPQQPQGDIMETVIAKGDLSRLTAEERNRYYLAVCKSVGLNPLTKPLEYLPLNGRLVLYARRDAADQLRKIHGISLEVVSREFNDDLFTVHVRAKDRDGREDEDLGVVSLPQSLKGEARANMIMKATTKAKRRVTLSISGLGFLDETEIEDIPRRAPVAAPNVMLSESATVPLEDMAREAAMRGRSTLREFFKGRSAEEKERLKAMHDELEALIPAEGAAQ